MRRIIIAAIFFTFLFAENGHTQTNKTIKVACIGNSITFGYGIKDRLKDAYPVQLGRMLGENYVVRNFGVSGRTLLSKGNMPYIKTGAYQQALEFNPDIVIIKLGTNDSKPYNWEFGDEFKSDYLKLLESFKNLESKPAIHLCLAVPVLKSGLTISDEIVEYKINPLIQEIAREQNLKLIDLFTPFVGKKELYADNIHPNGQGAGEMAKIIYKQLTGVEGKLVIQTFPGKRTTWKGFNRYDFEFGNKNARIIEPAIPLEGNPWVWRARFPGWHTEMDSILVSEGYHLAYINTNAQFGSPKAMKSWDRFYKYLIKAHNFNRKVALEGVSRGGLFVYNWAKQNPNKVSCIYAEAPVCDFKSWPAGFGASDGSKKDWEKLKTEYGFASDKEAKNYANNPIDNLEALAKAKVPVLHMIGLNDSVVPVAENSMVLINKYINLGGIATVIPCTRGKQTLYGHHFPIETPRIGADFIKYHTKPEVKLIDTSAHHTPKGRLQNSFLQFQRNKKEQVAFLDGSITGTGVPEELNLRKRVIKHLHIPIYYSTASCLGDTDHPLELRMTASGKKMQEVEASRIRYFFEKRSEAILYN
ncbi:GDSL-type esterase/lipase family protein [Saccharicrinis sp. GN24d3]|uniref:GDSL-type esterase/lipase family protein n=1 Tax=Saccharicrinis sp. GN24d3 TaxID=3458416 RepID=UPI0040374013